MKETKIVWVPDRKILLVLKSIRGYPDKIKLTPCNLML